MHQVLRRWGCQDPLRHSNTTLYEVPHNPAAHQCFLHPNNQCFPGSPAAWKWVSVKWDYTGLHWAFVFANRRPHFCVGFKHYLLEYDFQDENEIIILEASSYLSPHDIFQSCLETGGWSWHHWGSGLRKHFWSYLGKKLLDHVGIFISNLMRGSILDTNYAAMQTDLSKLQGEEEKRKIPFQNKGCLLQGNLLNLQGLSLNSAF